MSIKRIRIQATYEKGFLLPDVMIAVFVTVTALVAIMSTMTPLFKDEFFKRDSIIATALAQEGIELVRNARDNNWKTCTPNNTPAPCKDPKTPKSAFAQPSFPLSGQTYCTDYARATRANPVFPICANNSNQYIVPNASGLYRTAATGKFKRTIRVVSNGANRDITSTVTWGSGASAHTITVTDTLIPWGDQ